MLSLTAISLSTLTCSRFLATRKLWQFDHREIILWSEFKDRMRINHCITREIPVHVMQLIPIILLWAICSLARSDLSTQGLWDIHPWFDLSLSWDPHDPSLQQVFDNWLRVLSISNWLHQVLGWVLQSIWPFRWSLAALSCFRFGEVRQYGSWSSMSLWIDQLNWIVSSF